MSVNLLAGVRVIDLAGEPGAQAGRILCDLGADVVMVEPRGGGPARLVPPLLPGPEGDLLSPHFAYMAAGKRSVTLDLDREEGRDLLRGLVSGADVLLVTGDSDSLAARGIDYRSARASSTRSSCTRRSPLLGRTGRGASGEAPTWSRGRPVAASSGWATLTGGRWHRAATWPSLQGASISSRE